MTGSRDAAKGMHKTCVKCGLDCSDRPRVKDAKGNYACRTCVETPPSHLTAQRATMMDGIVDELVPLEEQRSESAAAQPACRNCPICLRESDADLEDCVHCGFNRRVGLQPHTKVGGRPIGRKALTCAGCGYDLAGLPSLTCPECGTVVKRKTMRELDHEYAREVTKMAYITPLIMFGIGGGIACLILLLTSGPAAILGFLLSYAISVPVGVLVFFVLCVVLIGFDAPLHLTALRLAGIYAVVDAVSLLVGFIPGFQLIVWIIPFLVYVYLLAEYLEIEVQEAFVVAVVTFVANAALLILLAYLGYSLG